MLTVIAFGLFKTLDNLATPCSVKKYGAYRNSILFEELEVANWLLQFVNLIKKDTRVNSRDWLCPSLVTPVLQIESANCLVAILHLLINFELSLSGLASPVPSDFSPANRICKLLGSNFTSSHKKRRSSKLGVFFCFEPVFADSI